MFLETCRVLLFFFLWKSPENLNNLVCFVIHLTCPRLSYKPYVETVDEINWNAICDWFRWFSRKTVPSRPGLPKHATHRSYAKQYLKNIRVTPKNRFKNFTPKTKQRSNSFSPAFTPKYILRFSTVQHTLLFNTLSVALFAYAILKQFLSTYVNVQRYVTTQWSY